MSTDSSRYTIEDVIGMFGSISEFKDTTLKPEIAQYIADCFNRMSRYEAGMNELLTRYEVVDRPLTIRIGPEVEFYNIAGEESFRKRLRQLGKADKENNEDPSISFEDRLARHDDFMPKRAQHVSLNQSFFTGLGHARHVEVMRETAYNLQVATERYFPEAGKAAQISNLAIFQHELASPPRSPYGVGQWLAAIGQRVIDKAPEYGLLRSEIITAFPNMSSSGLHLHISAIGSKDGKPVNILQRDSFAHERGRQKRNPAQVSQLALHVAHVMNEFLRDYIYIFAPVNNAYDRFSDLHAVGTSFIGFGERRIRLHQGSAMFRGDGRHTHRETDQNGEPDTGPLRIELRVPDVGCIGHPNKRVYQEQLMAPFDVVESLMYILSKGVTQWTETRQRELKGEPVATLTEAALYEQRFKLPRWAGASAELMSKAQKRGEGFLTASRVETITARGLRQQEINDLDRSPRFERGPTIDRSKNLSP